MGGLQNARTVYETKTKREVRRYSENGEPIEGSRLIEDDIITVVEDKIRLGNMNQHTTPTRRKAKGECEERHESTASQDNYIPLRVPMHGD